MDVVRLGEPTDTIWCYDLLTYAGRKGNVGVADRFIHGDIAVSEHVRHVVGDLKPQVIVNFAAESHVDNSYREVSSFTRSNVDGVVVLLEAVRHLAPECLFVQISTDEVYGDGQSSHDAASRLDPQNPYAATKAAAEFMVTSYRRSFDVRTMVTRSSNNWGPRQHPEKFIPAALAAKASGVEMVCHGYDLRRDWLHVQDNARAIYELILTQGEGTWNIATDRQYTLSQILDRIGDVPHQVSPERPGVDVGYWVDSSSTWNVLGWEPQDFMSDDRWDDYVAGAPIAAEKLQRLSTPVLLQQRS
jgi:dTDP-glucose 4,6-dehydratase